MTTPNEQLVLISPRDGYAGVLRQAENDVVLVLPPLEKGKRIVAGNFVNRFPDTAITSVTTQDEAIRLIAEYKDNSFALDFTILLFDRSISDQTRKDIAWELDELLMNDFRRDYVLDIMLSSPLPIEANSDAATSAAKDSRRVRDLVKFVLDSQPLVRKVHSAWLNIRNDSMVLQAGNNNVLGALLNFGVFRRLVTEGRSQADVEVLKKSIVLDGRLTQVCNPRIVLKFISEYSGNLPAGSLDRSTPPTPVKSEAIENEASSDEQRISRPRPLVVDRKRERSENHLEFQRIESQIEKIATLFGQGSDQPAQQILDQLIQSQTANTGDYSYVVKSLCNIASKCGTQGRRDITYKCLTRALDYPAGIDARYYIQIGNELRDLSKYEEALSCYNKAKMLDNGERDNLIQLEIIRTSVAKGDYELALQMYEKIPDIQHQPQTLCGLGTLHRKMGNLRAARERLLGVLQLDPKYHSAVAGLAEANKQSGRYDKAIHRYDTIRRIIPELEEGPTKIYSLATAFLFRMTRRFTRAHDLLTEINLKYPRDCDVHLQLAKLCLLMGMRDQADGHFQQAQGPYLDGIAAQMFRTAIGQPITNSVKKEFQLIEKAMPEFHGLANCNRAIWAIQDRDFGYAQTVLKSTHYVDHLQADFGAVLKYHAIKRINPEFDYKSDRILCRIAKRGYRELRQSMNAIVEGNFGVAENLERTMCLVIA